MPNIILATDYSDQAMNACSYALRLFGPGGRTYRITHAYLATDEGFSDWPTVGTELYSLATIGMAEWSKRLEALPEAQGAVLIKDVVYGPLPAMLNETAKEHGAELIVMGTQGASGAGLLGSSAAAMVKNSRVPVLVVPSGSVTRPVKRILFADDGQGVDADTMKMLVEIATRTRAEVLLAHVVRSPEETPKQSVVAEYGRLLAGVPHRFTSTVGQDVAAALDLLAEQHRADMIAVLHRHEGFIDSLFHNSTAKKLALHVNIPLLVLQSL